MGVGTPTSSEARLASGVLRSSDDILGRSSRDIGHAILVPRTVVYLDEPILQFEGQSSESGVQPVLRHQLA